MLLIHTSAALQIKKIKKVLDKVKYFLYNVLACLKSTKNGFINIVDWTPIYIKFTRSPP